MGQVLPLFVECPQVAAKKATCSECGKTFIQKRPQYKACSIGCSRIRKNRILKEKFRNARENEPQKDKKREERYEQYPVWDIITYYLDGHSLPKTQIMFKIGGTTLRRLLNDHEIDIRPASFYNSNEREITSEIKQKVVQEYISTNISAAGLCKKYNLSKTQTQQLTLGVKKMVGIKSGYKSVLDPEHPRSDSSGKVLEHIIVAETKLQRPVLKDEQIHHIDFNKHNNNPENLAVGSPKSHGFWHKTHAETMTILMPIMLEIGIVSFSEVSGYDMDPLQLKRLERLLKKGKA